MKQISMVIQWFVVIALQVLLFNNLQFWGLCQPQVYLLCLLMFPITLPRWADMLIGMALGLFMDILCNSIGVHMATCIFIMFIRQPLLAYFVQEHERLTGEISLQTISMDSFLKYTVILVFIHQICISMLSAWTLQHFGMTILQILISATVAEGLILGYNIIRAR